MRLGPDLNASTSFDQSVYTLTVPTDSEDDIETAFQILEDWAHGLTLDPQEIEKERGVVLAERRARRNASTRVQEERDQVIFSGSRYAERVPIGTLESIERSTATPSSTSIAIGTGRTSWPSSP